MDQSSAKRFFIERIASQPEREKHPLSRAEKHMLAWSESDPEFEADDDLVNTFEQETTEEAFESKVSALVRRAYSSDIARDPSMRPAYQQAYRALSQGDHYLLAMIDPAVGSPAHGLFRHGFGASVLVAARHAVIGVGVGLLLGLIKVPEWRDLSVTIASVGFVVVVTFCAVLLARLMGARTFKEASINSRPGSEPDLGGTIPVAVISAVVSALAALVVFGTRR